MVKKADTWVPYVGPIERQALEERSKKMGRPTIYDQAMGALTLATTDEHTAGLLRIAKLIGKPGNASAAFRWLIDTANSGACWELLQIKAGAELEANQKQLVTRRANAEPKASDDNVWVPYEPPTID